MFTSPFWGYNGSYITVETLEPGGGYLIKVASDGVLIRSPGGGSEPALFHDNRIRILHTEELPTPGSNDRFPRINRPAPVVLWQKYPNPFNPTTEIRHTLSSVVHVSLTVYNVLGQYVATVVDRIEDAGHKSAVFDGANLPSGIYLYKLQAGTITDERKMIPVK